MMTETVDIPEEFRNLTFEKVWAAIMVDRQAIKEAAEAREIERKEAAEAREKEQKEAAEAREIERLALEKERKEAAEAREIERLAREKTIEAWEKERQELQRQMGDLHRSFGDLAEHLVVPKIHERFNELGYHFGAVSPGGQRIFDEKGKTKTEIDILLENKHYLMAVEVKTKPKIQDIEHHVNRLKILREYRDKMDDKREIRGAIAGAVFGPNEKKAVIEAGLYVLEQSGDTMKIEIHEGFTPCSW